MRRSVLILLVISITSLAHAQTRGGLAPAPFYGSSTSVIDHNGNLIVFDLVYSYPTPMPSTLSAVKTRVTVITPDGTVKPALEYPGTSFQVLGAGWYAVYAIFYGYPTGTGSTANPTRRLVAFNIVAGVPLAPLPTIDAPIRANVELSPARDGTAPDLISFVDPLSDPRILSPTAGPAVLRFAQVVKYMGGSNFAAGARIPLP
jgi:hypothetical protein